MNKHHEWTRPWAMTGIPMRHAPLPQERRGVGTHPSERRGMGLEIVGVRKLEPGDDRRGYSPAHSPNVKEPHAIVFRKEQELRVIVVMDLPPAMAFGEPSKRDVVSKVAATVMRMAVQEPNNGIAIAIGVGRETRVSEWVSDEVGSRSAMHRVARVSLRAERGDALSRALRRLANDERECLIVVLSDFLMPLEDEEWKHFEDSYQVAQDAGHEIVCIRVLDSLERALPSSASVTIASGRGSFWTSSDVAGRLRETQKRIRRELMRITGDDQRPDDFPVRFLEIAWSREREEVRESLKLFWKIRARHTRAR